MQITKYLLKVALGAMALTHSVNAAQRDFEVLDEYIQDGSPHYRVACKHNGQTIQIKVEQGGVIKVGDQCETKSSRLDAASFVTVVNELCVCPPIGEG